jgi:hypothetical protein
MKALSLPLLAVALFSLFPVSPAQAACSKESCDPVGPPLGGCVQVLANNTFDDSSCNAWQTDGGYIYLRTEGTDRYYDIYARSGTLYQDVGEMTLNEFEASFTMEVVNRSAAGSERLYVELYDLGARVNTRIAIWSPSTPNGTYNFNEILGPFVGRNLRFRFRLVPGATPGDSYFRIRSAYLWNVAD